MALSGQPMSALDQKQTFASQKVMSVLPPKADIRLGTGVSAKTKKPRTAAYNPACRAELTASDEALERLKRPSVRLGHTVFLFASGPPLNKNNQTQKKNPRMRAAPFFDFI